jgi:hypothetical protein
MATKQFPEGMFPFRNERVIGSNPISGSPPKEGIYLLKSKDFDGFSARSVGARQEKEVYLRLLLRLLHDGNGHGKLGGPGSISIDWILHPRRSHITIRRMHDRRLISSAHPRKDS